MLDKIGPEWRRRSASGTDACHIEHDRRARMSLVRIVNRFLTERRRIGFLSCGKHRRAVRNRRLHCSALTGKGPIFSWSCFEKNHSRAIAVFTAADGGAGISDDAHSDYELRISPVTMCRAQRFIHPW